MKSPNWQQFTLDTRAGNWQSAVNYLSSLAMFEMLPALHEFNSSIRSTLMMNADRFLYPGAAKRVKWAAEAVEMGRMPGWQPADLPPDQLQDARRYLQVLNRPSGLDSSEKKRNALIQLALSQVGSHYLWGAAGATPGFANGMPGRPASVERVPTQLDPASLILRAASCNVSGYHVCAGRFANSEVGGSVAKAYDKDLQDYILKLESQRPENWQPKEGKWWPRLMQGRTVTTQIVWAEDCFGKRHFDCVGFINWCLSAIVGGAGVQLSIEQYQEARHMHKVDRGKEQKGDIVMRGTDHIGFVVGDGRVVHASYSAVGVIVELYAAGTWTDRTRYPL
jgi:cell wall-associated NlpC family hydrolase